jgi:biotin carboxylase
MVEVWVRSYVLFIDVNVAGFNPARHSQALGTSPSAGLDALAAVRRLGYGVVVASAQPDFYGPRIAAMVDRWLTVDSRDPALVADAARDSGLPIVAALSFIDQFLSVAAQVCALLKLRGATPESPALSRSKARVREALDKAGMPNPRWAVIPADDPALTSPIGYPCIAKPIDGSASWDVSLVHSDEQLQRIAQTHLRRTTYGRQVRPAHRLLLEEELIGPLYSAEGSVADGDIEILAYSDRRLSDPPRYYELSLVSTRIPPRPEIDQFVRDVMNATGYDLGPFHLEFIDTAEGPRLVELNPRVMGAGSHQCVNLVCGLDLVERVVCRHLRLPAPQVAEGVARAAAFTWIYPDRTGVFDGYGDGVTTGVEQARSGPGVQVLEVTAHPGDKVVLPESNSDTIGYVVTVGDSAEEARARGEHALALVEPRIRE